MVVTIDYLLIYLLMPPPPVSRLWDYYFPSLHYSDFTLSTFLTYLISCFLSSCLFLYMDHPSLGRKYHLDSMKDGQEFHPS